jgi:uncharacterized radical SAM protein YgiQ
MTAPSTDQANNNKMNNTPKPLDKYKKYWAKRFGTAPFLPMSRAEMDELGWDSCDIIIVTGDAYIDHPSFGMALVGRLLENQGFRVGIIAQPDWQDPEAFRTLGQPNLFFGVTAGNMDSMINRYTADKKPRSDDAYTPHAAANKRPDRAVSQYAQRCRQAFPGVGVMIGSIEASLRRIAHFDYWSENVRPSVLISSKADILLYGNAERALVEIAHRVAAGEKLNQIRDVRGTAFLANHGWLPDASWQTQEETTVPDVIAAAPVRGAVSFAPATNPYQMKDKSANMLHPTHQAAERFSVKNQANAHGDLPASVSVSDCATSQAQTISVNQIGRMVRDEDSALKRDEKQQAARTRKAKTVVRLPAFDVVQYDPVLYAHASRVLHVESNPGNARALVQQHGERDVWLNPPPIPLEMAEMDYVFDLPYARNPHPSYGDAHIPAWEMIKFSVNIMRGCFGGCTFCSITEHEGRIIQSRSEDSILKELEAIRDKTRGFTGQISDLGGPTANMYRMACKDEKIEHACRRLSCVYPDICENLNTDHTPLISLYRKARALNGIKKINIQSGLRYDLAVRSPEYIKELVQHHVGGYLKIAPEHTEEGPLSKMMKPRVKAFDRFKELFEQASREVGKEQYLIPYFIAAHPGTSDEDMMNLALWLKNNNFRLDQVQAFVPTPMAMATTMWHTRRNPLKRVARTSEKVDVVREAARRRLHKAFLRYHDPDNWPMLRDALVNMGRSDLIGYQKHCLIPTNQPVGYVPKHGKTTGARQAPNAKRATAPATPTKPTSKKNHKRP